jgi:hypothetical protein
MAATPKKRRSKGSLAAVMRGLFTMFQRHQEFVEDPASDHETCVKSTNAAVQVALAYCRAKELFDIEDDMRRFEDHLHTNGDH